jgi:hypothetical protein
MEHLFSPCTRFVSLRENQDNPRDNFSEDFESLQELNLDVSTEELLSAERAFTYADLYALLGSRETVLWLTPHASVVRDGARGFLCSMYLGEDNKFSFKVNGESMVVLARSLAALFEIVDVVRHLVAANASEVYDLELRNSCIFNETFFDAASLASLMEQCQNLKALTLHNITLDGDHFRVLGDFSKPGLEVELKACRIAGAAAEALVEVLGRNQGPTKLTLCDIDIFVLADVLRGKSCLKSLSLPSFGNSEDDNPKILAIAAALKDNKGLVDLDLTHCLLSDEVWNAVCDSLKAHPTLQVLKLQPLGAFSLTLAVLTPLIQALVNMLKVNTSIHTIDISPRRNSNHELFRRSVIPSLKTNRLRPRLLAIQKIPRIAYRVKVLGRALLAVRVRTDPNRFWMLLSGNAEVVFPSTTATTAPAANLPTPVGVSANATASATYPIDSGLPTVNDAVSTSGQKRKACP